MNILVIGSESQFVDCQNKFGEAFYYIHAPFHEDAEAHIGYTDVVFDFTVEDNPFDMDVYRKREDLPVFVNAPKFTLAEFSDILNHEVHCLLIGFNGLPGFFNLPVLELSLLKQEQAGQLSEICKQLGTDFQIVADRVGMVSPRVICMIINEAYFTLQEGTANKADIDAAMKLGTAYPCGPFEWAEIIGLHHVFQILEAVYTDTHDERYKICPLLKREYMLSSE
jgi:3-hydroxybutyryl-CoA dehydrogenase